MVPEVLQDGAAFSPSGVYVSPPAGPIQSYQKFIETLPINPNPEVFGLHENADMTYASAETRSLLESLLALQPRTSAGASKSREDVIRQIAEELSTKVPKGYDMRHVLEKYPFKFEERWAVLSQSSLLMPHRLIFIPHSMNNVLVQECVRYNRLLQVMRSTLTDLVKATKGYVVMSEQLERMGESLFDNRVPMLWAEKAYPSLKPLSSWFFDLLQRIRALQTWIDSGTPHVFWMSGFFFPQAFLTGALQNFARKLAVSIDRISFGFEILKASAEDIRAPPEMGVYISGLFLEGARWDSATSRLAESRPLELYTKVPVIWLKPEVVRAQPKSGIYRCPVYKTLTRQGTLSTTGHSTNFVVAIEVPTDLPQEHWVMRGVALICSLDY